MLLSPVPQVKKLNWRNFKGKKFIGWKYVPLRKQFDLNHKSKFNKNILILSGGTNNNNFSVKILKKLNIFKFKLNLIINLGFDKEINHTLKRLINKSHHKIKIQKNNFNISKIINDANLIITTFGISAYEIAALKRYSIIYAKKKDDIISSSIFEHEKISRCINNINDLNENFFKKVTKNIKKSSQKKIFLISKDLKTEQRIFLELSMKILNNNNKFLINLGAGIDQIPLIKAAKKNIN